MHYPALSPRKLPLQARCSSTLDVVPVGKHEQACLVSVQIGDWGAGLLMYVSPQALDPVCVASTGRVSCLGKTTHSHSLQYSASLVSRMCHFRLRGELGIFSHMHEVRVERQ